MTTNTRATYMPKPVQLRLKHDLHAWVHHVARTEERSANWIINKLLEEAHGRAQMNIQGTKE